ncbi:MAG: hypothetical protein Q8L64_05715 [bacterium]|nr:hypothetical protein [bacterium]
MGKITIDKLAEMTMRGLEEVKDVMRHELRTEIGRLDKKIDGLDQKIDYRFNALSNRIDDNRVGSLEEAVFGTT